MPWNPITQWQDDCNLGGHTVPGICEVVGAGSPRQWDEQKGPGMSGAFVVFHGKKLAHFSIKTRLYSVEDWNEWDAFKPFIEAIPLGRLQGAFDITHPITAAVNIRSVVIEEILAPIQTGDGEWTIEIKLIEFRKPKLSIAKPDGAQAEKKDPEELKREAKLDAARLRNEAARAQP